MHLAGNVKSIAFTTVIGINQCWQGSYTTLTAVERERVWKNLQKCSLLRLTLCESVIIEKHVLNRRHNGHCFEKKNHLYKETITGIILKCYPYRNCHGRRCIYSK